MTIYQRMEAAFALAEVPLFLQEWRKTDEYPTIPDVYAVYNVNTERPALCADDAEIFRRYDIEIWLYGTEDVSGTAGEIEQALECYDIRARLGGDRYAKAGGEHLDVRRIDAVYVDFGEYRRD